MKRIFFAVIIVAISACSAGVAIGQVPALDVTQTVTSLSPAGVAGAPQVAMTSGILVDMNTRAVLWAKNDELVRPPASLTKILTALVVLDRVKNLDETAPITPDAREAPGGRTYAEAGWTFTIRDLLWGLLLQSGNDSAIALAHKVSPNGTVAGFMDLANKKAKQLGATHTSFVNPHGYDAPGHVTTARDLAIITIAAMQNPVFAEMVASKTHQVTWGDGQPHLFINHNKLLARYPGAIGVKTGFTNGAGHGLVSAVKRGDDTLIVVAMDSPDHYGESIALYDWGFAHLAELRAAPVARLTQPSSPAKKQGRARNAAGSTTLPDVVQLHPQTVALESKQRHTSSGPLVAPVLALIGAIAISTLVMRKRRRPMNEADLMDALRREIDSIEVDEGAPAQPV